MLDGRVVVLDLRDRELSLLREDVSAYWPLFDGTVTGDELAREAAQVSGRPVAAVLAALVTAVDHLRARGLLELHPVGDRP